MIAYRREHAGLSALGAGDVYFTKSVRGEEIPEEAHLEILATFRAFEMMVGRLDCEPYHVNHENNKNQSNDNQWHCGSSL